jgi:hypothetical protein
VRVIPIIRLADIMIYLENSSQTEHLQALDAYRASYGID